MQNNESSVREKKKSNKNMPNVFLYFSEEHVKQAAGSVLLQFSVHPGPHLSCCRPHNSTKFPIEWNKCSPTPYDTIFIQPEIAKAVTYNSFFVFKTMLWWKRCIYSLTPRLSASHLGLICLFSRSSEAFCSQLQSLPIVSFRFSNSVVVVLLQELPMQIFVYY